MGVGSAEARVKRHRRVRKRVSGTGDRPRLAVFRSNRHIYAQVIDDTTGRTLASASTAEAPLRDAGTGTGVIAGGAGRAILEAAGVHDVLAKSLGSSNPINVARSVINGLQSLKRPEDIARLRGKSPEEVTPAGMLRAYTERNRPARAVVEVQ